MRPLFVLFLLLCLSATQAQVIPDLSKCTTLKEKFDSLQQACERYHQSDDYQKLGEVATFALKLCRADDYRSLSQFHLYLGSAFANSKGDSAIHHYELSLAYARKTADVPRIRELLQQLLYLYSNHAHYLKQRDATVAEILAALDTTNNEETKAVYYVHLSDYYGLIGDQEKAIDYLLKKLALMRTKVRAKNATEKDIHALGVVLANIGENYLNVDQPEKALEYTREADVYLHSSVAAMSHVYKDFIEIYLGLDQPEAAKKFYDTLGLMLATKHGTPDQWSNLLAANLNFGDYYADHNQGDSAVRYAQLAKALEPTALSDVFLNGQVNYVLGKSLAAKRAYKEALPYLDSSVSMAKDWNQDVYLKILLALARCYDGLGDQKKASEYYSTYIPLRDTLSQKTAKKTIADAEAKYQARERQQLIDSQRAQLQIARAQRGWLLTGLGLVVVVLGLLLVIYRNNKKTGKLLDQQNRELQTMNDQLEKANQAKTTLFGIISHDLRGPISQVYQYLRLQQRNTQALDEAKKKEWAGAVQSATGSLLESMEDLLIWSKTQLDQFSAQRERVEVSGVMEHAVQLLSLQAESKSVSIRQQVPAGSVVNSDKAILQLIVRNLLQNAIKASPAGSHIDIQYEASTIRISNPGQPFNQSDYDRLVNDANAQHRFDGLGLKVVQALLPKIGAVLRFEGKVNSGTVAVLELPA